jgi:predicted RNA methylase
MATKERRVPDHVLAMLEEMEANGTLLHMHPRKLARSDYEDMNRVVTALGGQWKGGKTKAHVFPPGTDVAALVDTVLATGRYEDPKDADFVETPVRLASSMADRGRVRKGSDVFEPSAGLGRIARAARSVGGVVKCVELSQIRAKQLEADGFPVICADFLTLRPATEEGDYDVVLMNPPFSKQQDIQHVRHAYRFLRVRGRLVAIMSAGVLFRQNKKTVEFREWVESLDGEIEELPDGTFANEGTMVRAVIVTIVRA